MRSFVRFFFARAACGRSGSHRSNVNKSTSTTGFFSSSQFFPKASKHCASGVLLGGSFGGRMYRLCVFQWRVHGELFAIALR